ncbi:MAG: DUF1592 domain-containing protein [Myxococcota bacterium]
MSKRSPSRSWPLWPLLAVLGGCEGIIGELGAGVSGQTPEASFLSAPAAPAQTYLLTQKHLRRTLLRSFGIEQVELRYDEPSLGMYESNRLAAAHSMIDFQGYFSATEKLVLDHSDKLFVCDIAQMDDACLGATIAAVGKKLFRRTLTAAEVEGYKAIAASQGPTELLQGARYALVALLNSPHFLYQKLYGVGGRLTDMELASRVGFFLLGGNPDLELIDAAESGALSTPEGLAQQVDRLLVDSVLREELFADALSEIWRVNHLDESLTAGYFPNELQALQNSFTQEFKRTAAAVHRTGDWRGLFRFDRTVVNKSLAEHYGIFPAPPDDSTWREEPILPARSGLLANGAMMVAHSGGKYTSTIHRGLFILNHLLCRTIYAPANLNDLIQNSGIELSDSDTVAERVQKIGGTQPCGSCHGQFDPYGLVYESFDAFGRYATVRDGAPVEARSTIDGKTVESLPQLATVLLEKEDRLAACFFRKVRTYGTGAQVADPSIDLLAAHGVSAERRFDFDQLVRAIVLHDSFRFIAPNPNNEQTP